MTAPQISELVVKIFILIAQILMGRLFFTEGRKKLSPGTFAAVQVALICSWVLLSFYVALDSVYMMQMTASWIPAVLSTLLVGFGTVWGVGSGASLGIFYLYRLGVSRLSPPLSPARRRLIQTAGAAAVASPFAVTVFGAIVERTNFHVKEIELPVPNLHSDLDGMRIGQLSDLHVSPWLSVRDAGRTVDMLNELKPHLTVVTGDLISEIGDPLDPTIREIARLRADAGVIGCLGNHEHYCMCEDHTTRESARYGIDFLRGRARQFRRGHGVLNVAGVDFQSFRYKDKYLVGAEKLVAPGAANLLLSHNPDVFPVAVRKGYDAVLAGHTHGGQVTVEILNQTLNFARFATPYVAGLYRLDGRSCYVTAGIGTIAMPVRIGAPPEITLLTLRRA